MLDAVEDSVEMCKVWRRDYEKSDWRNYLAKTSRYLILTDSAKVNYLKEEIGRLFT